MLAWSGFIIYGMAAVITIPTIACAAVETVMVSVRTFVADTSQKSTEQTGPIVRSRMPFQMIYIKAERVGH
jgi:hypothetical protein